MLLGQRCTEKADIYSFGVVLWCAVVALCYAVVALCRRRRLGARRRCCPFLRPAPRPAQRSGSPARAPPTLHSAASHQHTRLAALRTRQPTPPHPHPTNAQGDLHLRAARPRTDARPAVRPPAAAPARPNAARGCPPLRCRPPAPHPRVPLCPAPPPRSVPHECPQEVDAIIERCLAAQPSERPSAVELVQLLERVPRRAAARNGGSGSNGRPLVPPPPGGAGEGSQRGQQGGRAAQAEEVLQRGLSDLASWPPSPAPAALSSPQAALAAAAPAPALGAVVVAAADADMASPFGAAPQ